MTCRCDDYDSQFSERVARRDLRRFRRRGPDRTTRWLLEALEAEGVERMSLLDVGGGVGAIHHALLDHGVGHAVHVDAAAPYLRAAREEAARRGHTDRVEFVPGDFVAVAGTVGPADIVTLDRVICCYPNMERLVTESASRARHLYGVVYPRDRWWIKLAFRAYNFVLRLQRSTFRTFVHATAAVDAAVRREGLAPRRVRRSMLWQVVVYAR